MSTPPKLTSPLITVIRENAEPFTVQTDNRDMLLWETVRIRHKWPAFNEAPVRWLTFLSWSAARRTGQIPAEITYEVWETQVLDVSAPDDTETEEGSEVGSPFVLGAVPDS